MNFLYYSFRTSFKSYSLCNFETVLQCFSLCWYINILIILNIKRKMILEIVIRKKTNPTFWYILQDLYSILVLFPLWSVRSVAETTPSKEWLKISSFLKKIFRTGFLPWKKSTDTKLTTDLFLLSTIMVKSILQNFKYLFKITQSLILPTTPGAQSFWRSYLHI